MSPCELWILFQSASHGSPFRLVRQDGRLMMMMMVIGHHGLGRCHQGGQSRMFRHQGPILALQCFGPVRQGDHFQFVLVIFTSTVQGIPLSDIIATFLFGLKLRRGCGCRCCDYCCTRRCEVSIVTSRRMCISSSTSVSFPLVS